MEWNESRGVEWEQTNGWSELDERPAGSISGREEQFAVLQVMKKRKKKKGRRPRKTKMKKTRRNDNNCIRQAGSLLSMGVCLPETFHSFLFL
mmetsp:Transcript_15081/g.30562  ORF Transcript_15081/g.30562 Transcript_15081/m.30562 type:complete len:92 (+) Transcript_15081:1686-1961(+)